MSWEDEARAQSEPVQDWEAEAISQSEPQGRPTLAQAAFPGASKQYAPQTGIAPFYYAGMPANLAQRQVSPMEQKILAGAGDAMSLPTRTAGAVAGAAGYKGATGGLPFREALASPETGLLRPVRKPLGEMAAKSWAGGEDGQRGPGDIVKTGLAGLGYLGASMAEDPAVLVGGAAELAPKVVGGLAKKSVQPFVKTARAAAEGTANTLESGAKRVQNTIIRPRQLDEAAGFKIENVDKYGVGGSLEEVIGKSQSKIEDAAGKLKTLIKQGKDDGARVDLNKAVSDVEQEIFKGKAKEFANLKESPRAIKDLKERIALLAEDAPGGKVDLVDAQYVKQALGDMGAFEHIAGKQGVTISKEDRALSQISSRVYLKLKDQIEAAAPAGVKELNRTMSDLIPVNRAAMYRKLVADRNNVVSMSDMLGALGTIGGGPKGLALWAASRATKSGNTAKALYGMAKALRAAKSPAEAEFYAAKLKSAGITAAEIEAIRAASDAAKAPNAIPFRKVAEDDSMTQPQASR